jgi:hypothetical protein
VTVAKVISVPVVVPVAVMVLARIATPPLESDVLGKVHTVPPVVGIAPLASVFTGRDERFPPVPQPVRHHKTASSRGAGELDPDAVAIVTGTGIETPPRQGQMCLDPCTLRLPESEAIVMAVIVRCGRYSRGGGQDQGGNS